MDILLDENYWSQRYTDQQTGWDIGHVSPPIENYINQLSNKELKILIPGCGNGYEGEYLHQKGFPNVYQMDLSKNALNNFHSRVPSFPEEHLLHQDFFRHNEKYDLIFEQTFFCALNPNLRSSYVQSMAKKLLPGGKIVGLLFNTPLFTDHPPFGGSKVEYIPLFEKKFYIKTMETAYNSIPPRADSELFIILEKK